jgi:hypothetical protein
MISVGEQSVLANTRSFFIFTVDFFFVMFDYLFLFKIFI